MKQSEPSSLADIAASLLALVEYERSLGLDEWYRLPGEAEEVPVVAQARPSAAAEPLLARLAQSLSSCQRCPLHRTRRQVVFGTGNPQARLAFVGEGPGRDEDLQGEPFVGAAGQLLTRIIEAIGLTRQEVYICNIVKCRPPHNRTPEPLEQQTCGPFVDQQLEIVSPEVIVALGATAANYLLATDLPLRRLRGRFHERGAAVVMPTYHPAYLLRTPSAKREVWEDMKKVRDRLGSQP